MALPVSDQLSLVTLRTLGKHCSLLCPLSLGSAPAGRFFGQDWAWDTREAVCPSAPAQASQDQADPQVRVGQVHHSQGSIPAWGSWGINEVWQERGGQQGGRGVGVASARWQHRIGRPQD